MCRMLLCISPQCFNLSYPIRDAPYSLKVQSYKQHLPGIDHGEYKFLRNPKQNMDGYGVFYINESRLLNCSKSKYPISDEKTHEINKNLEMHLDQDVCYCFGVIRNNNFKEQIPDRFNHVQPFRYGNKLFAHNGGFNTKYNEYTPKMLPYIDNKFIEAKLDKPINSMSAHVIDSMWLFGLFVTYVDCSKSDDEIIAGVHTVLSIMDSIKDDDFNISMNVIFSDIDNNVHMGVRYRTCEEMPPSMYYNINHPILDKVIASEPLDYRKGWNLMDDRTMIIIRANEVALYDISVPEAHCKIEL